MRHGRLWSSSLYGSAEIGQRHDRAVDRNDAIDCKPQAIDAFDQLFRKWGARKCGRASGRRIVEIPFDEDPLGG